MFKFETVYWGNLKLFFFAKIGIWFIGEIRNYFSAGIGKCFDRRNGEELNRSN